MSDLAYPLVDWLATFEVRCALRPQPGEEPAVPPEHCAEPPALMAHAECPDCLRRLGFMVCERHGAELRGGYAVRCPRCLTVEMVLVRMHLLPAAR